jgi:PAS domain S-box-containing protein
LSRAPARELAELRTSLAVAQETLRAIQGGEVDAVVVVGKQGRQVFTLKGAEHNYRMLIESMNEGALTLTADKMILYANLCFARMVKCPLEQVMGDSFRRYLSAADRAILRPLMKQAVRSGSKIQVQLIASDGSQIPVQISIRRLADEGNSRRTIGMVVTDMTEVRRVEQMLRALTNRVVQVQEAERASLALELHDNITQVLCAVLFSCQALSDKLEVRDGPAIAEAANLRALLSLAAGEVERISRNLRPSVLEHLGLVAVLHDLCLEFTARTGVKVRLAAAGSAARLPADVELALFRIFQEAMKNVEQHAGARRVRVSLGQPKAGIHFSIRDDGIGWAAAFSPEAPGAGGGLGLMGMRERAAHVGGTLKIVSSPRGGTEIDVRVPRPAVTAAAA